MWPIGFRRCSQNSNSKTFLKEGDEEGEEQRQTLTTWNRPIIVGLGPHPGREHCPPSFSTVSASTRPEMFRITRCSLIPMGLFFWEMALAARPPGILETPRRSTSQDPPLWLDYMAIPIGLIIRRSYVSSTWCPETAGLKVKVLVRSVQVIAQPNLYWISCSGTEAHCKGGVPIACKASLLQFTSARFCLYTFLLKKIGGFHPIQKLTCTTTLWLIAPIMVHCEHFSQVLTHVKHKSLNIDLVNKLHIHLPLGICRSYTWLIQMKLQGFTWMLN